MNMTTWLGEWLECTIRPTAKERTYTRYHEIVAQHLIPAFGGIGSYQKQPGIRLSDFSMHRIRR